jgi:hypothetical protein
MRMRNRMDSESEYFHRPGEAGGTPREIPDPTDEDLIEVVSTLYEAVGDDVEVFAQGIGMEREEAEEVITTIRERREDALR